MTDAQKKIVDAYIAKFGGVEVVENVETFTVQLKLAYNMVRMEGVSLYWLNRFSKEFFDVTVGIPSKKNEEIGMHITMFTKDVFNLQFP